MSTVERYTANRYTADKYTESAQARRDLHAINARFIENFIRNDVTAHDRLLHKAFTAVQSDGSVLDRAAYLAKWATGFDPDVITYWDVRDEHITIIGDVALVRSTNRYVVHRDGTDHTGMTTYIDTYVYEEVGWRCVQAQTTPVAAEHQPADDTVITVYVRGVRRNDPGPA